MKVLNKGFLATSVAGLLFLTGCTGIPNVATQENLDTGGPAPVIMPNGIKLDANRPIPAQELERLAFNIENLGVYATKQPVLPQNRINLHVGKSKDKSQKGSGNQYSNNAPVLSQGIEGYFKSMSRETGFYNVIIDNAQRLERLANKSNILGLNATLPVADQALLNYGPNDYIVLISTPDVQLINGSVTEAAVDLFRGFNEGYGLKAVYQYEVLSLVNDEQIYDVSFAVDITEVARGIDLSKLSGTDNFKALTFMDTLEADLFKVQEQAAAVAANDVTAFFAGEDLLTDVPRSQGDHFLFKQSLKRFDGEITGNRASLANKQAQRGALQGEADGLKAILFGDHFVVGGKDAAKSFGKMRLDNGQTKSDASKDKEDAYDYGHDVLAAKVLQSYPQFKGETSKDTLNKARMYYITLIDRISNVDSEIEFINDLFLGERLKVDGQSLVDNNAMPMRCTHRDVKPSPIFADKYVWEGQVDGQSVKVHCSDRGISNTAGTKSLYLKMYFNKAESPVQGLSGNEFLAREGIIKAPMTFGDNKLIIPMQ